MFSEFLDPSLTYSAALFDQQPEADLATASYEELSQAQLRKLDAILDAAGVRAGSRVLDIGCGWASLAIRAAQRGAWVTAITIASQQALLAQRRIADAGVSDRVQVALRDYRDQIGVFDAVLSVEMIEAVGEKYWPVYFDAIERRLAPGGKAVVQAIVMPHERMLATRNTFTWVQKYIFPGGLIPSVEVIQQVTAQHTGLQAEVTPPPRAPTTRDPPGLAKPLHRPLARHRRPRLRRHLPPHVGVLPRLLRSRLPRRLPRRRPTTPHQTLTPPRSSSVASRPPAAPPSQLMRWPLALHTPRRELRPAARRLRSVGSTLPAAVRPLADQRANPHPRGDPPATATWSRHPRRNPKRWSLQGKALGEAHPTRRHPKRWWP